MLSGAVSARGPLQLGTGVPATASPAAFRKVGLGAVVWGRGEQPARFCIWSFRPGGGVSCKSTGTHPLGTAEP